VVIIANKESRPVFTYLKSRGFYAGIQFDGTVVIERTDENERFYGERISVADILAGKPRHPPYEIQMLMETVKAAEGSTDVDQKMLDSMNGPTPADNELSSPAADIRIFGVPEVNDPDPFGVLALEKEGLEIREAGTKERPLSNQFEFNPSPTSPLYSKFHRRSMDTLASRSNRESYMSTRSNRTRNSIDRATQTEMGTQTDELITPITSPTNSSFDHGRILEVEEDDKTLIPSPDEIDYTKIDLGVLRSLNNSQDLEGPTPINNSPLSNHEEPHMEADSTYVSDEDDLDDEEPVVFEAAEAQARVITPKTLSLQGGVVNIPKRPPPPPLPPRSSARSSRIMVDQGSGRSPLKEGFEEVPLHGVERRSEEKRRSNLSWKPSVASDLAEDREAPMPESPKGLGITMHDAEKDEVETSEKSIPEEKKTETAAAKDLKPTMLAPEVEEDTFHSLPTTPLETIEVK